jgi:hypothetical protein
MNTSYISWKVNIACTGFIVQPGWVLTLTTADFNIGAFVIVTSRASNDPFFTALVLGTLDLGIIISKCKSLECPNDLTIIYAV